eukprot:jgi/Botrbrau1/10455/Bobra.0133s0062.1
MMRVVLNPLDGPLRRLLTQARGLACTIGSGRSSILAGCHASMTEGRGPTKKPARTGGEALRPGYEVVTLTPELVSTIRFRPITTRTTTRKQKITVPKKAIRDEGIREFWSKQRGVTNAAYLQRFENFGRVYPRYRDMKYLKRVMVQWDIAIREIFQHDRGMEVANNMARRHPFILNAQVAPSKWAINAVRGRLPAYDWEVVLRDLQQDCGDAKVVGVTKPVRSGRRQAKVTVEDFPLRDPVEALEEEIRLFYPHLLQEEGTEEDPSDGTERDRGKAQEGAEDNPSMSTQSRSEGPGVGWEGHDSCPESREAASEDGGWGVQLPLASSFAGIGVGGGMVRHDTSGEGPTVPGDSRGAEKARRAAAPMRNGTPGAGRSPRTSPVGAARGVIGERRDGKRHGAAQSPRTPAGARASKGSVPPMSRRSSEKPMRSSSGDKSTPEDQAPVRRAEAGSGRTEVPSEGPDRVSSRPQPPVAELESARSDPLSPLDRQSTVAVPDTGSVLVGDAPTDSHTGVASRADPTQLGPARDRGPSAPGDGSGNGPVVRLPSGIRADVLVAPDPWVDVRDRAVRASSARAAKSGKGSSAGKPLPGSGDAPPVSAFVGRSASGGAPTWGWTGKVVAESGTGSESESQTLRPIRLGRKEREMEIRIQTAIRRAREARERMRLWPRRTTRVYAVQGRGKPASIESSEDSTAPVDDRT